METQKRCATYNDTAIKVMEVHDSKGSALGTFSGSYLGCGSQSFVEIKKEYMEEVYPYV